MSRRNRVAVYRDEIFKKHINSAGHPESPARLEAVDRAISSHENRDDFDHEPLRKATTDEIARVHTPELIQRIAESESRPHTDFDYETAGNNFSYAAALSAAGAAITGVDAAFADPARPAYAAVRPPGHHAEKSQVMGFCLFNSAAVAAEHALANHDCSKVFIFDWDVHHGNGTMHSFYHRDDIFYASIHQFPHYPGTGTVIEIGQDAGTGFTLNIPVPPGCGDPEYRYAIDELIVPAIRSYSPDLVIISAGFDAHKDDPLSSMSLTSEMYGDMTTSLKSAADEVCEGRMVVVLEGGYSISAMESSNVCMLSALAGSWDTRSPNGYRVDPRVQRAGSKLQELLDVLG